MTRTERLELLDDMRAAGCKRWREGALEVEMHVSAVVPRAKKDDFESENEMPSREELAELRDKIQQAPTVGPKGT